MELVDTYAYDKPTVLIPRKGSITNIFYVDTPFWNVDTIYYTEINTSVVIPKYLYYFFTTIDLAALDAGAGRPSLTQAILNKLEIPVPCPENPEKALAIQAEIVRILDAFTALTNELTNELNIRLKKFNYYRNFLLHFKKDKVEWKELYQVAEYSKCKINFKHMTDKNFVGVDNLLQDRAGKVDSNHVPQAGNLTRFNQNDILIGNIRPYLKKIWHAEYTGGCSGDVLAVHLTDDRLDSRFLYHLLAADRFFSYNMRHARGGKMPRGNKKAIMKYPIPIPRLDEQARIVAILDQFDTLTQSLTEGLPREIELRQKQYEYYRDLLFDFPRPESARAAAEA